MSLLGHLSLFISTGQTWATVTYSTAQTKLADGVKHLYM